MDFLLYIGAFLTWICFIHFIGDFVFQTSWMALGKSKSFKPLVAHISTYTLILILGGFPVLILSPVLFKYWIIFSILNGCAHMCTDFITSRLSSKAWGNDEIRKFWIIIGFDQFLHMATLFISVAAILNFID